MLPEKFRALPKQAMKAKLHGILLFPALLFFDLNLIVMKKFQG
jgi:hypothetical protein